MVEELQSKLMEEVQGLKSTQVCEWISLISRRQHGLYRRADGRTWERFHVGAVLRSPQRKREDSPSGKQCCRVMVEAGLVYRAA